MGRERRGPLDQSERKQKATGGLRGRRSDPIGHFSSAQNREIKKKYPYLNKPLNL